jgi:formylglycine-generating enzyme required for sulfatase activity
LAGASAAELVEAKVGALRSADLGGGVELKLCGIPAGTFTMGSPEGETGRGKDETPHEVTLTNSFWLGRTEVTQAQWEAVMGSNPSNFKGDDLPVDYVSWDDAALFCRTLNGKNLLPTGWRWMLPTEAQWEYACRARTTGDYAGELDEMAWRSNNSDKKSHAVGTKKSNAWGLYDMHGNVDEWCADWCGDYPGGAATDPTGPNTGSFRVFRGGSWVDVGACCRSAKRYAGTPVFRGDFGLGFRVAVVPAGAEPAEVLVPGGGAGARDEQTAPLAGTSAAELARAKVGAVCAADLGGGMKLLLCGIPAGTFTMGGSGANETPHQVTLTRPFWLGRSEVTQAQWEAVMGSNPSSFKGDPNLPVEQVSWNDASEFCKKLNAKGLLPAGWRFALPTEAQWEYACRAGTTGDYAGSLDDMAWYSNNSGKKTHPVATKKANAWGLHDMHGNVDEWCADWYGDDPAGTVIDPTGPGSGSVRVYRGGTWNGVGERSRSAARYWHPPDYRGTRMGFRVAAVPAGR